MRMLRFLSPADAVTRLRPLSVALLLAVPLCVPSPAGAEPAPPPPFLNRQLPAGERPCLRLDYPTVRLWRYQHTNDVEAHATCRGVGADSGLLIYTSGAGTPGEILVYDVGVHGEDLKTFKGLCFWMRGDGGDGELSIGSNWSQAVPAYPRVGRYPLAEKTWKKHFVPWEKFTPDVSSNGFWFLNLKVAPARPRPAWAVVARVALYKDEVTEPIQPPTEKDAPGMVPAAGFVHPGVAEAAALLPRTLAKLKARQPVTIVAAGDSITAGAQLWYRNRSGQPQHASDSAIYFASLEERLARHYGYSQHRAVLKMWEGVNGKTGRTPSGATNDSFAVVSGATASAADPLSFDGLQVIGVGAGGKDTQFGFQHLADVTQYKPDLAIWFYGANDMPNNNRKGYETFSSQAIQALKAQGIEVLLCRPTFFLNEPYFSNSAGFLAPATSLAASNNIPWVDAFGAFNARGRRYVGDLLSDDVHPNEHGHRMIGAILAAALGVPDQTLWDQPMFQAVAAGAAMPGQ
jgi:lysophospholipase L1-like esterase